jgi:hypothetical protein
MKGMRRKLAAGESKRGARSDSEVCKSERVSKNGAHRQNVRLTV